MTAPNGAGGGPAAFDVVATYRRILSSSPSIAMPAAAVEALADALSHSRASTVFEIVDMLTAHANTLKAASKNPISLTAGCEIFLRYVTATLTDIMASKKDGQVDGDFDGIRGQLVEDTRHFVARAKGCKEKIVSHALKLFPKGKTTTVLTNGRSRVVAALLRKVAESPNARLRVIYVMTPTSSAGGKQASGEYEGQDIVRDLRSRGIPVATIPAEAVAFAFGHLRMVDMVLVGAEAVIYNGGIISRLGTYQIATLARRSNKPVYVLTEMFKFVRLAVLGQAQLPVEQSVLNFTTKGEEQMKEGSEGKREMKEYEKREDLGLVDLTHPEYIDTIITENGYMDTSQVFSELQKIWT